MMRFIPLCAVLLTMSVGGLSSGELNAQELAPAPVNIPSNTSSPTAAADPAVSMSAPVDTEVVPIETTSERVDSIFSSSPRKQHPGLLGKIFLQNRYRYLNVENKAVGDSWQGFDTLLNLPAFTLDTPVPLDVDVFGGYVNMELAGERLFRPDVKTEAFNIGASIYAAQTSSLRPFLQLGARFVRTRYTGNFGFPWNIAPDHDVENDTRLLLNAGIEYDLSDSLAYRLTLFAETKDRFEDSAVMNELILWPVDQIFVRGGITSDLNGNDVGLLVGGGLAF